jgi:hypothetical protein
MNVEQLRQAEDLFIEFQHQRAGFARRLRFIAEKCRSCRGTSLIPSHLLTLRVIDSVEVVPIPMGSVQVFMACASCAPVRRLMRAVVAS